MNRLLIGRRPARALEVLLLLGLAMLPATAQLRLIRGAADYQVYQRGVSNAADIPLYGDAHGNDGKQVEARILRMNPSREERGWTTLGTVTGSRWTGVLAAVPTGGPYAIEIRVAGAEPLVRATNVLVGDLWVLAGQSNMEGVGDLRDLEPGDPRVNSFDMTDTWAPAEEPLHFLAYALDRVHWRSGRNPNQPERLPASMLEEALRNRTKGAGLGLPFANELVKLTGVPIGLLPCAHGGTSMDQWDPAKKEMVGDSLYGSMLRRVQAAGGKVAGVLWYQGESDAGDSAAPLYEEKFRRFIAAVRSDFGQPDLPFYYAQIGLHINPAGHDGWDVVQEAERTLELEIPHVGMVATVDAVLDDRIHASVESLKTIGQRFARLACHQQFPDVAACQGIERGPRPARAERIAPRVIRLECETVNGKLTAAGKMWGFTVVSPGAQQQPEVFKVVRDPANPSALLVHFQEAPVGAQLQLYYSKGRYSYANIVDEADMALPAFGPMPVQ
ncbi:MAG: sialate O-acetylesterase [Bryobacterales bacterium]|nr:sialate O-acetylesterase [Bryobacterales bacterium]